jgi:hypothetical protein
MKHCSCKSGSGLTPAGGALKLAGQGKKNKRGESAWITHVKKVAKDKKIAFREAMKIAKATYKK